jgi:hypothetical protein
LCIWQTCYITNALLFAAIQAYVTAGTIYPEDDDEFEKKLPESSYDDIHKVKPNLYHVWDNHYIQLRS